MEEGKANDPAMLRRPGDKIRFDADNVNGQFTVTKIEKKACEPPTPQQTRRQCAP